jgi:hypothetical protein
MEGKTRQKTVICHYDTLGMSMLDIQTVDKGISKYDPYIHEMRKGEGDHSPGEA